MHASRESISFSQPEHDVWPVHQMVLRCKLPDPQAAKKGAHMYPEVAWRLKCFVDSMPKNLKEFGQAKQAPPEVKT
eukprot:2598-Pelagomonas_calceolata.AAC.1